jgi:hypothetical protein
MFEIDEDEHYPSGRRFHRYIVATLSGYRSAAISFSGYFFKSLNGRLKRTPCTPENGGYAWFFGGRGVSFEHRILRQASAQPIR